MSSPTERPPSVDRLARSLADIDLPHPMLVEAARAAIGAGDPEDARRIAEQTARRLLRPVINGTGTLLHTNLGRAPMAWRQDEHYSNLELDLESGRRGSRLGRLEAKLIALSGAESAHVVNNNAAAVLLALNTLALGREGRVARGEWV